MEIKEEIREYYNPNAHYEWERLSRHPIEFNITIHYLDKYIKQTQRYLISGVALEDIQYTCLKKVVM